MEMKTKKEGHNIRYIHIDTETEYDPGGYDRWGYDKDGYDKDGYNREGIEKNGKNREERAEIQKTKTNVAWTEK